MSEGLNRAILIGNLGADAELRQTSGGQARLRLRLATTESYKDRDGQRQKRTEWHTVIVWGKRAEALERILRKGKRIGVEGRIRTYQYEDKEGAKKSATEINATQILLLDSAPAGMGASADGSHAGLPVNEEDIPF